MGIHGDPMGTHGVGEGQWRPMGTAWGPHADPAGPRGDPWRPHGDPWGGHFAVLQEVKTPQQQQQPSAHQPPPVAIAPKVCRHEGNLRLFVVGSDAQSRSNSQSYKHGELAAGRFLAQSAWPSDRVWMALLPSAARSSDCKSPTARFVLR